MNDAFLMYDLDKRSRTWTNTCISFRAEVRRPAGGGGPSVRSSDSPRMHTQCLRIDIAAPRPRPSYPFPPHLTAPCLFHSSLAVSRSCHDAPQTHTTARTPSCTGRPSLPSPHRVHCAFRRLLTPAPRGSRASAAPARRAGARSGARPPRRRSRRSCGIASGAP